MYICIYVYIFVHTYMYTGIHTCTSLICALFIKLEKLPRFCLFVSQTSLPLSLSHHKLQAYIYTKRGGDNTHI